MMSGAIDMRPGAILRETTERVRAVLGPRLDTLTVERAVIGLFFTAVKLSDGSTGTCATPLKTIPEAVCCPSSAMAMPFPGKLRGRPAASFFDDLAATASLRRTLAIAVLNALSEAHWRLRPPADYTVKGDADGFDELGDADPGLTVVVGALVPMIRELKRRKAAFRILELDASTLKPDELPFFLPAERAAEVVPRADALVITGTTLINDTLEGLLALARPRARVIVVGPTASFLPDAMFRRGVTAVAGVRATDGEALLDVLAEGGSGYHIFGRAAERVVMLRGAPA